VPNGVHLERLLKKLDLTKIFHYEGSLTVPPCTENVEWNIIDDPLPISKEQLAMFTRKWSGNPEFAKGRGNNRKAQLLHSRKIYYLGSLNNVLSKALLIVIGLTTYVLM
jgi:carbonic anhydrase